VCVGVCGCVRACVCVRSCVHAPQRSVQTARWWRRARRPSAGAAAAARYWRKGQEGSRGARPRWHRGSPAALVARPAGAPPPAWSHPTWSIRTPACHACPPAYTHPCQDPSPPPHSAVDVSVVGSQCNASPQLSSPLSAFVAAGGALLLHAAASRCCCRGSGLGWCGSGLCQAEESAVSDGGEDQGAEEVTVHGWGH